MFKATIEKNLKHFQLTVNLEVAAEILVLFGPSGAGKTQTLNAITGLTRPDRGEVLLNERLLFRRKVPGKAVDTPVRHRRIGFVFQDYALFPHLSALDNVAYPLRPSHSTDSKSQALAWLERMHMVHLATHYPGELSGGQQQRVAIARALAARPELLLLDEPFSALDSAVKESIRNDLKQLQRELGLIVLYVTHSLEDALDTGDRIAVMQDGRIEQIGNVEEVLNRPANSQTARILGIRNLFRARVIKSTPEALFLDWKGLTLKAPPRSAEAGARVTAYIRPEEVKILYPDRAVGGAVRHNRVTAFVVNRAPTAGGYRLRLRLDTTARQEIEIRFSSKSYSTLDSSPGTKIQLSLRQAGIVIL